MKKLGLFVAALAASAVVSSAHAGTVYNTALASPGTYFGGGNPNTNWAVDTEGNIELGLKAQQRGVAAPVVPSGNIYSVPTGADPTNANRAWWNFDFSINLRTGGGGSLTLGDVTPTLRIIDFGTGNGISLNPLLAFANDNSAYNGSGPRNGNTSGQQATPADFGAQNSENLTFAQFFGLAYDMNANDTFLITLLLSDANGNRLGKISEYVVVGAGTATPLPASLPLFLSGLAGLGLLARRRKQKTAN